ncbi:MAG TPA: transketolase C-terminal domain-containing protein, partial [Bacteroidales bacterium]|nr:transketolase C-terminal domain-containing protein [Bacteroidales bacterium]
EDSGQFVAIAKGKGRKLRCGSKVAVISLGHPGNFVAEALNTLEQQGVFAAHYDLRFLKPLDKDLLLEAFSQYEHIITVEDGVIQGGMGSAILEWAAEQGFARSIRRLGIPGQFVPHGAPEQLYRYCGFDSEGIVRAILEVLE